MADVQTVWVTIDGRKLDLMGSLQHVKMTTDLALRAATGRNHMGIPAALGGMAPTKEDLALSEEDQAEAQMARLASKVGSAALDAVADLVFIARRAEGDKSATNPARPISYEQVCDELSIMDALQAISAANDSMGAEEVEEDPTTAQTASALGESNGDARNALKASLTS